MNGTAEKLLLTAIGSFLGFALGLLAMRIKERRERVIRIRSMCISTNLLSLQLREVLHEDPKLNAWLKIEGLFQFLDLLDEPLAPVAELRHLLLVYSQWSRGFYLAGGIKSASCNAAKVELQRIADGAQANLERAPRLLRAVRPR